MTPAQLSTLRTAIFASGDQALIDAANTRNDTELARLLNLPSTFVVWRDRVTQDEIMQNGFDWVRVDNLSIGKARIWEWLFDNQDNSINPSKENVRAGINECWKGTAADLAVRAAVYVHCKKFATVAERFLATGTGSDASPGLLTFSGTVSINDIGAMMNAG